MSVGSVSTSAGSVSAAGGVCHAVGCELPSLPLDLAMGLLLQIGVFVALTHVPKASTLVAQEREEVTDELDALTSFQRRVAQLDVVTEVSTGGDVMPMATRRIDGQLDRLADAYRETVMSVPHYESRYGDPIEIHMAAEFSEGIAAAVVDGDAFTPQIKHAVIKQCREGRQRRAELLDMLDEEAERLSTAGERLREIDTILEEKRPEAPHHISYTELFERWETLGEVERECRELIEDHQPSPTPGTWTRNNEEHSFREYLYSPLETDNPVLDDGTRLVGRIQEARRSLSRWLARRV